MRLAVTAVLVGVFSTFTMDLMNLVLSAAGLIGYSDPQNLGNLAHQWLQGRFWFASPREIPPFGNAQLLGVITHYLIGIILAGAYLFLVERFAPRLLKSPAAIGYGFLTSVFAWFFLFPSLGFGPFGMDAPPQIMLFKTSVVNHISYGLGIFLAIRLTAHSRLHTEA